MGDTGGKSGRRPGRHLQVKASWHRDATIAEWRLVGRVGGKRGDVEVTGWGLGRPTACILRSRSRRGPRRVGTGPGPENAPSANFSVAGCGDPRARARAARRRRGVYGASILGHVKVTAFGTARLYAWVKRLARPQARLPSPSPLSAVLKDRVHVFCRGRSLFRARNLDAAT